MIKAKGIFVFAAALVLCACGKPKIVPDDELAQIFHDVYLTNAYADQNRALDLDSLSIYEPLFARYGYTSEDIQFTIGNFAKRKSARLSDDVVEKAIEMLRAESRFYSYRIHLADTLARIAREKFAAVVYADTLIRVRRIADTARLRITLPVKEGSYSVSYSYTLDSLDRNQNLRSNIYLVDERGRQSAGNSRRLRLARREEISALFTANGDYRSLVLDLNGYPRRDMTTPSLRIDTLVVKYYLPDRIALDSMTRGLSIYRTRDSLWDPSLRAAPASGYILLPGR